METTSFVQPAAAPNRSIGVRAMSLVAALALVFAAFILLEQRADASPSSGPVAAAVASAPGDSVDAAQLGGFASIICPILIAIRNAFAASPFFAFVQAILNNLLLAFGCAPS